MAVIQNGTAVNFGLGGTALTLGSTAQTGLFQSFDHKFEREKSEIKNESGALVSRIWFNPGEKATLTYFISAAGTAAAITATVLPDIGTFATIATCTQYPALNKTTWEVVDATMKGTNTTAKEVTLQLEFHAGVIAVASSS